MLFATERRAKFPGTFSIAGPPSVRRGAAPDISRGCARREPSATPGTGVQILLRPERAPDIFACEMSRAPSGRKYLCANSGGCAPLSRRAPPANFRRPSGTLGSQTTASKASPSTIITSFRDHFMLSQHKVLLFEQFQLKLMSLAESYHGFHWTYKNGLLRKRRYCTFCPRRML